MKQRSFTYTRVTRLDFSTFNGIRILYMKIQRYKTYTHIRIKCKTISLKQTEMIMNEDEDERKWFTVEKEKQKNQIMKIYVSIQRQGEKKTTDKEKIQFTLNIKC